MNKITLKRFAKEARRELIEKVELQARKIGITAEAIQQADVESSDAVFIDGKRLSDTERRQRNKLIARIDDIGFQRVMDEAAYTWFNRFIALRFMEVNDYLPTKVRVLSSTEPGSTEPDMIREALSIDLELDKEKVYEWKVNNNTEALFKYLIKQHCNDLNRYMPFMFETIEDYTEILFPGGLLGRDSFVRRMTDTDYIPENNWEKIEVIGWLYQYYIVDEKDRVFKQKTKYKAEEIPYATQLFTPDWIVRYMVQNSLGRYWAEAHPEHNNLKNNWDFYLEHEEEDFQENIAPYINKELNVEGIKCLDPAMGSGHILVYMFDVLFEIYSKCGYNEREIPRLIIENNLYGLDIDDRAYQLASFSVVMKAIQYNRRFLRSIERESLTVNLASIQETNGWREEIISYIAGESEGNRFDLTKQFIEQFHDAKTFGSLLKVQEMDLCFFEDRLKEIQNKPVTDIFQNELREQTLMMLPQMIKQSLIMSRQYDVVVMNPPYMGARYMSKELAGFLSKFYPDSKSDLFAAFMELNHFLKEDSFYAAVNQHSWMFLSSFERLRKKIINKKFIDSMLHLGSRAFEEINGEVVQSTTFVLRNNKLPKISGIFVRLTEERTATAKIKSVKKIIHKSTDNCIYLFDQDNFNKIPGSPIAYWGSENAIDNFINSKFGDIAKARAGMITGNNDKFTRLWSEVSFEKIGLDCKSRHDAINSQKKWFPYSKGGGFRKWYGNNEYVVDWENDGFSLQNTKDKNGKIPAHAFNFDFIFKKAITWSSITSFRFSARSSEGGALFDAGGSFAKINENQDYFLGFLNSKVAEHYLSLINPTLNFQKGNVESLPVIENFSSKPVEEIVKINKAIAKKDWDSFENSWDFLYHPLVPQKAKGLKVEESYKLWVEFTEAQCKKLKLNEEEINQQFIKQYDLQEELSPEVGDKEISIRRANLERDIKSLISYMVGCTFGRYSLDEEGLIYAGGEFNSSRYTTFPVDKDNILPILSGSYFEDDIVTRFVNFIRVTFTEGTLGENLNFVTDALGRKKDETAREALRRYFLNDFYKDHVQVYKKRPIYWLFTSGKEKAFNCLIYMHRYDKTTLSRIRTDYLHEVQTRMDSEKKDLLQIIEGDSTAQDISTAKQELKVLGRKIDELKAYDEKLHHMADMQIEIDLDDGVKVNYAKFDGLVSKM